MFLLYIAVLMMIGFRSVNCGSAYMKPNGLDYGDLYNSTNYTTATQVKSKAECAMSCESAGDEMCQSFNFKQSGEEMRCEMFDHLPVKLDSLVSSPGDQFYEKQCKPIYATASVRKPVANGAFVALMVNENRQVYQVNTTFLKPRFIGYVPDVFIGYKEETDDIVFGRFGPFIDVFLLRFGLYLDCFREEDDSYTRFRKCEAPEGLFPKKITDVFGSGFVIGEELTVLSSSHADLTITVWKSPSVISIYEYVSFSNGILRLKSSRVVQCSEDPSDSFCKYVDFWEKAESAIVLKVKVLGLFVDRWFYVYDYVKKTVVGRYPVCLDREAFFFV